MTSEVNRGSAQFFCERHPDEEASLICGGCAKRICTICLTLTGEGVRCPDCMARLNTTPNPVTANAFQPEPAPGYTYNNPRPGQEAKAQVGPNGQIQQRDTGFRTYWKRTPPRYLIEPRHYLLAVLAAISSAVSAGIVWGFLLNAPQLSGLYTSGRTSNRSLAMLATGFYRESIHFLPEILVGVLVAEAVARVTKDRRSGWLQFIAGAGVLLAFLVAIATLLARLYMNAGTNFPPIATLVSDTGYVVNALFTGGGTAILVFWLLGIAMAVFRLKR